MAREVYATAGKKMLVDFLLENRNRHYTVEEIAEHLPEIGKSSVYRLVGRLYSEGFVRRKAAIRLSISMSKAARPARITFT